MGYDEDLGSPPQDDSKPGVNTYLVITLALLLVGVIVYLLSMINHQRYFLIVKQGQLTVERGRLFPIGSTTFKPNDPKLAGTYAALTIPIGARLHEQQAFDSLGDLDRRLFSVLAGWARKGMQSKKEEEFEAALMYVDRARKLPGLSDEQQRELGTLRGDIAYRNGRRLIRSAVNDLRKAHKAFRTAHELGTSRPTDAYRWMVELETRLRSFPTDPSSQANELWLFSAPTDPPTTGTPPTRSQPHPYYRYPPTRESQPPSANTPPATSRPPPATTPPGYVPRPGMAPRIDPPEPVAPSSSTPKQKDDNKTPKEDAPETTSTP